MWGAGRDGRKDFRDGHGHRGPRAHDTSERGTRGRGGGELRERRSEGWKGGVPNGHGAPRRVLATAGGCKAGVQAPRTHMVRPADSPHRCSVPHGHIPTICLQLPAHTLFFHPTSTLPSPTWVVTHLY